MRLDKYLAEKIPTVSRAKIQKAIKDGQVLVNGEKITETDHPVNQEDTVSLPEFKPEELKPYDLELKVVFENDDVAVIDKPAGLVVHPGAGNTENTLANALLSRFPGIDKVGEPHRPGIVHRLDEDTSGLILVVKNQKSYEYYKALFSERKIEKEYLALVHGELDKKHYVINAPLEKVPLKQKMRVGSGKPAVTEYWVLERTGQFSLIRVKLHTGRTHQIRAHLSHIGHPIVGDAVYGKTDKDLKRQFLHASKLKFQLADQTWIELKSDLPDDLRNFLNKLNIIYDNQF